LSELDLHGDVIVVGAGPVGATAALLLAMYGIRCTVLEHRSSPQTHPAAHVLSTRSLEIWRELGLERDVRRLSAPLHELRAIVYCTTLAGLELGRVPVLDLPPTQLDDIESISPTRAAHLPQNLLEPLLWQRLRDCDLVDFRPGCGYVAHVEDADAVTMTVDEVDTGRRRQLRSRYVIAADGASSSVRRAIGVGMEGPVLQHMVSVHFGADLERYLRHRRGPVIWTHTPKGLGTIIVHKAPDDLVFQIPYFPPVQSLDDFTDDVCRRQIVDAVGEDVDVVIKSVQSWAMTAQVADAYRAGRVFLAGDAAHRFPPTGGLGLNTGVADVHNLAWKLAWVLTGRAKAALLDTYEQERRPLGLDATADSVANFDGLLDVVAALGLSRRAVRALPALLAVLPYWVPRRAVRSVVRGVTALGYQRLRLPASPGWAGQRIRRRVAAIIAQQGPHYRSWGRDLGVRYDAGAVVADGLPATPTDPEFYTPSVRAGARLPHGWVGDGENRLSTIDLVDKDQLTLLVSTSERAAWMAAAAAGLPLVVQPVDDHAVWTATLGRTASDAVLVRPDGHIAALLQYESDTVNLRRVVAPFGLSSLAYEGRTA